METASSDLVVACLCAAWCHVCNDYRSTFDTLGREALPGVRWRWIDIEDDEDLLDGVDVDDFPTLLVADRDGVRFFGVIAPTRRATQTAVARATDHDTDGAARLDALAQRLLS